MHKTIRFLLLFSTLIVVYAADSYQIQREHPRIFVNKDTIKKLAANCAGPLAPAYKELK